MYVLHRQTCWTSWLTAYYKPRLHWIGQFTHPVTYQPRTSEDQPWHLKDHQPRSMWRPFKVAREIPLKFQVPLPARFRSGLGISGDIEGQNYNYQKISSMRLPMKFPASEVPSEVPCKLPRDNLREFKTLPSTWKEGREGWECTSYGEGCKQAVNPFQPGIHLNLASGNDDRGEIQDVNPDMDWLQQNLPLNRGIYVPSIYPKPDVRHSVKSEQGQIRTKSNARLSIKSEPGQTYNNIGTTEGIISSPM
jgi:hypothetical protein